MTKPTVPTDYTPEQLELIACRNEARRITDAMGEYQARMSFAVTAADSFGGRDEPSVRRHCADAKAALHAYPELLALVEGKP